MIWKLLSSGIQSFQLAGSKFWHVSFRGTKQVFEYELFVSVTINFLSSWMINFVCSTTNLNPLLKNFECRKGRTTPHVGLHFIRWVCGNSYWGAVGLSGGIGTSFHSGSPRVRPLLTQQLNLRAFDLLWVSLLHLGVLIHLLKRPCIFPVKPELYPFAFFSHICYDLEFKYLWFLKVTYVDRYPTNMYEVSD